MFQGKNHAAPRAFVAALCSLLFFTSIDGQTRQGQSPPNSAPETRRTITPDGEGFSVELPGFTSEMTETKSVQGQELKIGKYEFKDDYLYFAVNVIQPADSPAEIQGWSMEEKLDFYDRVLLELVSKTFSDDDGQSLTFFKFRVGMRDDYAGGQFILKKADGKVRVVGRHLLKGNNFYSILTDVSHPQWILAKRVLDTFDFYLPKPAATPTPSPTPESGQHVGGVFIDPIMFILPHPNYRIKPLNPKGVTTNAVVLFNREPEYTRRAWEHKISGTVVLKAVFSADGKVRNIRVIHGLPDYLTDVTVEAVSRMLIYKPAMKDGHAVSQEVQLEYRFKLSKKSPN